MWRALLCSMGLGNISGGCGLLLALSVDDDVLMDGESVFLV